MVRFGVVATQRRSRLASSILFPLFFLIRWPTKVRQSEGSQQSDVKLLCKVMLQNAKISQRRCCNKGTNAECIYWKTFYRFIGWFSIFVLWFHHVQSYSHVDDIYIYIFIHCIHTCYMCVDIFVCVHVLISLGSAKETVADSGLERNQESSQGESPSPVRRERERPVLRAISERKRATERLRSE